MNDAEHAAPEPGPQTARVIAASRSPDGVCQSDFLPPNVIDGLAPITRVGARIRDAKELGFTFEILGWRRKTRIYRLVSEPAASCCSASNIPAPEPEQQAELPLEAPPAPTAHWRADL